MVDLIQAQVPRTGVLLANTGTPDAPTTPAVRRYLREFLSDPRVIDIPAIARWLLLNLIILPVRPARSAHAYRAVWRPDGSPLLVFSEALRGALQRTLGDDFAVALGMRYGRPSLDEGVDRLMATGAERIVVVPLFPQYASASNGSVAEACLEILSRRWNVPEVVVLGDFFDDPGFLRAQVEVIEQARRGFDADFVLFSYHGLPVRQVRKSEGPGAACDRDGPCPPPTGPHRMCYRAQCYATSRALAAALGLGPDAHATAFQSRLGRTPWIEPHTDVLIEDIARRGARRLLVACPSFVADCLETVEEVGIRLRAQWASLGGEGFELVPCLNDHPAWVEALAERLGGGHASAGAAARVV